MIKPRVRGKPRIRRWFQGWECTGFAGGWLITGVGLTPADAYARWKIVVERT